MDRPVRKQPRLPAYDYSAPGAYFVTICTQGRRYVLWDEARRNPSAVGAAISRPQNGSEMPCGLTCEGEIIEQAIRNIPLHYPHVTVDKYVIMPNHIHLIVRVEADASGRLIAAPTISTVIGQMKRWASKQAGKGLWQKSFYEHVIRNERDYREIWDYIDGNPGRWAEDRYFPP